MSRRELLLESCEERILCNAALPLDPSREEPQETVAASQLPAERYQEPPAGNAADGENAPPAAASSRELIVINRNLPDADRLIAELTHQLAGRSFEVVMLDTNQDGIAQLTARLAAGGTYDAVHILTHGQEGGVLLGATMLETGNFSAYESQIAQWREALSEAGDLIFYGCDLAADEAGRMLVQRIAQLTGADVAASTDATGGVLLGGNWTLEYAIGPVESQLSDARGGEDWNHLLGYAPLDGGTGAFAAAVGNRLYVVNFDTGKATLLFTDTALGTINSLGYDSVNDIYYYADSGAGSTAIYGWDARAGGSRFVVTTDVQTFGASLPADGLAAAGGDFSGGSYYFSTEGGGTGGGDGADQLYKVNFLAGSSGRTIDSIQLISNSAIPEENEFGDFLVDAPAGKFYSFDSGTGVREYDLTLGASPSLTFVGTDANTAVRQAARDRNNTMYSVNGDFRTYDPTGGGSFGTARTITTDGATALGSAADGAAYVSADASIGDRLWFDTNGNGLQDGGEDGIVGVTVSLYYDLNGNGVVNGSDSLIATTTTDANGAYIFAQLLPDTYLVQVTDPTGILNGGTSTTGGNSQTATITLVGETVTNKDFGFQDNRPAVSVSNVAVTEGTEAFAQFTVSLSRTYSQALTVGLVLADGAATGAGTDFGAGGVGNLQVFTGGSWVDATSATFAAGATSVLVRTPITNDARDENAETFTLTAARTTNAISNASATGTATITDNDLVPSLSIDDVTRNEAAGTATFTVTLSSASGRSVSVNYTTNSGTATSGADFSATSGTLNFAEGETSKTIVVSITNDPTYEGAETFDVTLSGAVNATIADGSGLGTIRDDGTGSGGTNDDRPINTLPAAFTTPEDATLTLAGISIANPDPTRTVTVTVAVDAGVLNLSTAVSGGVTAGQVSGNGSGTVTITASLNALNATLADAAGLRFVPVADAHGTVALTLTTLDGSSSDSDSSTITVTPVVDIADDTATTNEDTAVTISVLANDTFEDAGRTITAVDGQAITASGPTVAVANGTVALNASGQLIYTPTANYNGSSAFTYTVSSGGGTETANVTVGVNAVFDPLTLTTPTSAATTEDVPLVFSTANGNALVVADDDSGLLAVTLAVQNGTLTLSGTTSLTFVAGDGIADATMTFHGLATDINVALAGLTFTPTADYHGTTQLDISVADIASAAPNLINGGFEQPGGVSTFTYFNESAVDGWETSASDNVIEIWRSGYMGVPAFQGSQFAEINATQDATLSQTITPLTGGTLKFAFAHRGRAGVDTVNVRVTDLGVDGVLGGGDDNVLLSENFSDGSTAWGYYDRTLISSTGNPMLVEFTSVSTASGSPSVGNFIDGIFFGVPNGAVASTVAIDVTTVPDIADDTATTDEDTGVTIPVLTNDTFENAGATITAVDGQALVANGPAVVVNNGTVALNGAGQLIFTPTANFNGPTAFTYTVTSGGVTETANVDVTVTAVPDAPVLDLDATTAGTGYLAAFTENGSGTPVVGPNVAITDLDSAALAGATVVLTNAQAGDGLAIAGTLPMGISGSIDTSVAGQITVTLSGSAALADYQTALQQIRFSNTTENPATVVRSFAVVVNDGGPDSNTATSAISVVAINDAPAVTLPPAQNVPPGTAHAITGVSFSDADAEGADVTVTLSVTAGTLTVNDAVAGGLTAAQIATNGTASVTLTGSLVAINTTLADAAGLIFQTNTSGDYTLTAAINDGGNAGTDPSVVGQPNTGSATDERASDTLALTVTPPTLSITVVAVTEGTDGFAVFTVSLSNPSTTDVTLDLALANSGALGVGTDYGTSGVGNLQVFAGGVWVDATAITFAAGATSVQVRTPITDDALDENAEDFTLTATVTTGATTNASASGTATITDNDAVPGLSISDVTRNEAAGTITFTVTLDAPSGRVVSVDYAAVAGGATGADYAAGVDALSGTLNFVAGDTSRTITLAITDDTIFEQSESFNVVLSNAVNAAISDGTASGTILDDGTGSGGTNNDTPTLSVSDVAVTEGTDGFAIFTVSLSNPSTTSVTLDLSLVSGSATGIGTDYGTSGVGNLQVFAGGVWVDATAITFAAGATSVQVRTPITNDALDENVEDFTLTATVTAGTTTNASASGTATIADDDALPGLSIGDVTRNEAGGTITFTVTLDAPSGQAVSVDYIAVAGSATGADYAAGVDALSGTLNFVAGDTSRTITLAITDDTIFEQSESFNVVLNNAVNASLTDGSAVGTILDDGTGLGGTDDDTPTLSISDVTVTEGVDPYAILTVSLSNTATTPIVFDLALISGAALGGGTDYGTPGAGNLQVSTDGGTTWVDATGATFTPGMTSLLVRTPIATDALAEPVENFTLVATVTSGPTSNPSATGTALLVDDPPPIIPPAPIVPSMVNPPASTFVFAFDEFRNFSNKNARAEALPAFPFTRTLRPIEVASAALLPLAPIYAGEADPGATLVVEIYNGSGVHIASQTVMADAGGNWLANFSTMTLRDAPSDVRITQVSAPYSFGSHAGNNLRTYYAPAALNPGHFLSQSTSQGLDDESAPLLGGLDLANPLQLGPVKYGGEFLPSEGVASGN